MARRQAGDRRGRNFLLRGFKKHQSVSFGLLSSCGQGGENRHARRHLHVRWSGQPRTAADRRPAQRAAQALVGRHTTVRARSATWAPPRSSRRSATAPIASRNSWPAAPSSTNACRIIGARISTSISAAIISTNCDSNISAIRRSRIEAFKADHIDWRTENSAKSWATAYDFPAVMDKRVVLEEFPINSRGIMQAFAFNTRQDKFKDPRVRRAFNFAFNFEEMNKQIFFNQYRRIASYFDGTRACQYRIARGQGTGDPGEGARQGAAGSFHHALLPTRSSIRPTRYAPTCARPRACCARPAGPCATRSIRQIRRACSIA